MLAAHIAALNRQGMPVRLPDGGEVPSVPFSYLWLVVGAVMIGRVSVRYHLTPHLLRGGHLGYEIRPRYRRLGFGHRALALGIRHAREHGLCDLLLTCDDANTGSIRIIESAGGVLWTRWRNRKSQTGRPGVTGLRRRVGPTLGDAYRYRCHKKPPRWEPERPSWLACQSPAPTGRRDNNLPVEKPP